MKKTFWILVLCQMSLYAQTTTTAIDSPLFTSKSSNWKIVKDVNVNIDEKNSLSFIPGAGVLLCEHQQGKYGMEYELFSKQEHGDMDIEFDFMMAKGSNSGFYIQSRYEIQLFDSWGVKTPKYYDCGGIYERWKENNPEGEKGYEGYAPRVNVCKAPGLWQHMKISFQAPRFNTEGKKIANAKILFITLNGILIHENVELSGVTRGSISETEVANAPFRIQGDHGSIAFRNIYIDDFDKTPGSLTDLNYKVYYGSYMHDADLSKIKINESGKTNELTWEVTKNTNNYVFVINGKYNAPTAGKYTFTTQMGGNSTLKVDGKQILGNNWTVSGQTREASVDLTAGEHSIELFNNKRDGWLKPVLGFWSAGPGFRATAHHSLGSTIASKGADPIIINANTNTTLRSFMDFKKNPTDKNFRIVHAISVGSPSQIHYTYDLDKGTIVQAWKGNFLDATPMWNNRGDGTSVPLGSVTLFNHDLTLSKPNSAWPIDTTGSGYRPLGYTLDENDLPTFKYEIYGTKVSDAIKVVEEKYLAREISLSNANDLVAKVAEGKIIEEVAKGLYAIDDKSYFIKTSQQAEIKNNNELYIRPENNKISYQILF